PGGADARLYATTGCRPRRPGSNDIRLWDVATHRQISGPLTGHTNTVLSLAFSPDGKTLASSSGDDTVRLWDVATGQPRGAPLRGHGDVVNDVAFSPDGAILASCSEDRTIRLWDLTGR